MTKQQNNVLKSKFCKGLEFDYIIYYTFMIYFSNKRDTYDDLVETMSVQHAMLDKL